MNNVQSKYLSIKQYQKNDILEDAILQLSKTTKLNNGQKYDIRSKFYHLGIIDLKLDNVKNTIQGDVNKNNYKYQIKSKNCQIDLIKSLDIKVNNKIDLIYNYVKYNKANRYSYFIEYENNFLEIIMNRIQFKKFLFELGTYSKSRNVIRIYKSDRRIYKWIME